MIARALTDYYRCPEEFVRMVLVGEPSTDLEGRARVNDPATSNTGVGTILYADRGAYEFQATPNTITGRVFQDSNGDGSQQTGEAGLSGRTVYLDANNNGVLDTGEATATTDRSATPPSRKAWLRGRRCGSSPTTPSGR